MNEMQKDMSKIKWVAWTETKVAQLNNFEMNKDTHKHTLEFEIPIRMNFRQTWTHIHTHTHAMHFEMSHCPSPLELFETENKSRKNIEPFKYVHIVCTSSGKVMWILNDQPKSYSHKFTKQKN